MTVEAVEIPGYIPGTWSIDSVHSDVGFIVRHLMVARTRGRFTRFEGEIVTAADPLESSVTVTIELASIDTASEQRDAHLRSADFFEVEKHPTMTYRSTGLQPGPAAGPAAGAAYVLEGELTLKGVTRAVPLALEVHGFVPDPFLDDPYAGARAGFTAVGEIDRTDFGVNFNGPVPGSGVAIGNKVQILLEIEAALQTGRPPA